MRFMVQKMNDEDIYVGGRKLLHGQIAIVKELKIREDEIKALRRGEALVKEKTVGFDKYKILICDVDKKFDDCLKNIYKN